MNDNYYIQVWVNGKPVIDTLSKQVVLDVLEENSIKIKKPEKP